MLTRGWRICWITALSEILRCGRAEDSCWLMLTPVQSDHCYAGHWPVTSCIKEDCWGESMSNDRSQLDQLVKLLSSDFNLHPTPRDQHNHLLFCQWLTNLGLFGASERMGWFFHLAAAAAAAGELPHRRHSCSATPLLLLSNLTDLCALTNQQLHAGDFKDFELFASQEDCVNFVYQKKHLANLAAYAINLYPAHQLKTLLWFLSDFSICPTCCLWEYCKFEFANK